MLDWLNTNANMLGVFVALASLVSLVWGAVSFLLQKRAEIRHREFETYHRLIDELVRGASGATYVERQMAAIYELRKFRRYYQISYRIIKHLRASLTSTGKAADKAITHEIDLTISFLKRKIWSLESFK